MVSVIFAIVLLVVFLSAVDSQTLTPIVVDTGRNVSTFLNGAYKVSYLFGPTTVDVAITVTTNGWAAFGIRGNGGNSMSPADIIMFSENPPGTFLCEDKWSTAQVAPVSDTLQTPPGTFSILQWGATRSGGVLNARFIRNQNTGDVRDLVFDNPAQTVLVAFNSGSNDVTSQHTSRAAVVLSSGAQVASVPGLVRAHAFLMFLAFPCLAIWGMFIARYVNKKEVWWFPAHWILEGSSALLGIIAAILVTVWIMQQGGTFTAHFTSVAPTGGRHQVIGIIVLFGMLVQIMLGVIAHFSWRGPGSPTRWWPDRVHHWFGRGVLVLALFNIFFGIWAINYGVALFVLYAVFLVVLILILIFREYSKRKEESTTHYKEMNQPLHNEENSRL